MSRSNIEQQCQQLSEYLLLVPGKSPRNPMYYLRGISPGGKLLASFNSTFVNPLIALSFLQSPGMPAWHGELGLTELTKLPLPVRGDNFYRPNGPLIRPNAAIHRHMDVNLWQPSGVQPKQGEWPTLRAWLDRYFLGVSNREEVELAFMQWLQCLLYSEYRVPIIPILSGYQGAGKSSLVAVVLQRLLPDGCYSSPSPGSLLNAHYVGYAESRLLHLDEMGEAGSDFQDTYTKIKEMVTATSLLANPKFQQQRQLPVLAQLIVTTNADAPLKLAKDDRRCLMLQMAFSNPQEAARWGREVVSPFLADEVRLRSELGAFAYYLKHEVSPPADYRSMTCPMTDTKELAILDHDSPYDTFCRLVEESGFFDLLYQHPEVAIGGSEFSNAYSFPNLEAFIEDQRAVPIRLVYEVYREHHRTLESRGNHMTFNRFNSSVRKRPAPGFGKVVSTVFRAPMGLKHYVRVELTEEGMAEARIFFARKSGNAEKHRELATRAKQAEA